ncbi:hypothetical protein [Streptomyces sp. CMB-StM0423]|uniref:hypothetical protein n=1 Tax=Streptomyces sp. CMB-StM0423 TaxID=2059884 RepID=UPI000C70C2BD|nr:hypothetical protein [Streptomyces sp. CMB-StM0423]AUH41638.1 hypothetical protein CXR04_16615 [Streptomyces sp. CMB-StM0423]
MPPPSHIHVQQDAGRRHDALAHRIERIADACAPLVEDITGLLLPPRVVIRLATPGDFRVTCQAHHERLLITEVRELLPRAPHIRAAREQVRQHKDGPARRLGGAAQTILTAEGGTEILMTPKVMRRAGRDEDDRWLHLNLAQALCRPAQHRASQGLLLTLIDTPFPHARGVAGLALEDLTAGHAMWTGQQVRTTLLGAPPAVPATPKTSWVYRRHETRTRPAAEAVEHGGEDFVTYVVSQLGTALFNRLWQRLDLAPTHDELNTPIQWVKRIYPLLAADDPVREPLSARPTPRFN